MSPPPPGSRPRALRRALLASFALALTAPAAAASPAPIEIGATSPVVVPACPAHQPTSACKIILTQITALQIRSDRVGNPMRATAAGMLVGFTVGVATLSNNPATLRADVAYLNHAFGGAPAVALTVLRPVPGRHASTRVLQVVAESRTFPVQALLGQLAHFRLAPALPVQAGDSIALTTPTWAPVLAIRLASHGFAYVQSRSRNCGSISESHQQQATLGQVGSYGCRYPGVRIEYSATEQPLPTSSAPAIVDPFRLATATANAIPRHRDELALTELTLSGVGPHTQAWAGFSTPTAPAALVRFAATGRRRSWKARTPVVLTRQTTVVLAVTRGDQLGRFALYSVDPRAAQIFPVLQGCLPAAAVLTAAEVQNPATIPQLPCP